MAFLLQYWAPRDGDDTILVLRRQPRDKADPMYELERTCDLQPMRSSSTPIPPSSIPSPPSHRSYMYMQEEKIAYPFPESIVSDDFGVLVVGSDSLRSLQEGT